jgi:hypothetical protein
MSAVVKHKEYQIAVRQYLADAKSHMMAVAVIDIDELKRLETVLDLIPASVQWLYKNNEALESVQTGLKQATKGNATKLNLSEL